MLTWSSNDKKVATVDANGNVKGVKQGLAEITARANDGDGVKASAQVLVHDGKYAVGMAISFPDLYLYML